MSHLKQIVGLDIGARSVRAAWVQLRGDVPRVVRVEQMALPLEGNDTTALLRSWLNKQGLLKGFAAMPVSGAQLVFQPGRLAPEDPRTPGQAAEMELATFNEMAGDSMLSDVAWHEWSASLRVYLMAMARPAVVDAALAAFEPVGVRPADLVPAPVALFNALAPLAGAAGGPTLFVNIGHNQTELAIGTSKGILFARAFAMGGRSFTEAVAKLAAVPPPQAELQKQRDGTIDPGGPFAEVLRPLAERWTSQLAACLSAYRGAFPGEPFALSRVVLSGGGAQLRGLRAYLEERLHLPVVPAGELPGASGLWEGLAPRRNAGSAGEPREQPSLGQFDMAVGLALTALERGVARLSLLPASLRGEVVFREKKPYLIAASIMGALTLGVVTASMILSLRAETAELDAERAELRRREQMDKSIAAIRERGERLRKRSDPLRRLLMGGPVMREVISLVANAISPDDWISMICEETSYQTRPRQAGAAATPAPAPPRTGFFVPGFRSAAAPAAKPAKEASLLASLTPAPEPSPFNVFIVEGYTPDPGLTTVKAMILRLETAPRVRQVDLLSDDRVLPPVLPPELQEQGVELPNMRRFVIRLEVKAP